MLCLSSATAAHLRAPAGARPAISRPGADSILPGGRLIAPLGKQYHTGASPFGLAVSPSGKMVASADSGPGRCSVTVLLRGRNQWRTRRHLADQDGAGGPAEHAWRSVFMGLAFAGDKTLYASEGNSGRVRALNPESGRSLRVIDLNLDGYADSYTGDLLLDGQRGLLYVVDQANFRLAVVSVKKHRVISSVRVGRLPFAAALSPDGRRVYVTNLGMFEYKPVPGADANRPRETGLPFPAFGFPSPDAGRGARRQTAGGRLVDVPGLGDPNAPEANSLAVVNVEDPLSPRIEALVQTGLQFGNGSLGGSSPSGVLAADGRIFVSNGHNDSITVIDAADYRVLGHIPLRIPGLEHLRGVLPLGMAWHEASGWLLVAEAGINAVGVVDARVMRAVAHLPAGWFPTQVRVSGDDAFVSNAKGNGTGPNATRQGPVPAASQAELRRGTITMFPLPGKEDLGKLTDRVMFANGFMPLKEAPAPVPPQVRHVVLIVKASRTFDEVFGDIRQASNGPVAGLPALARFGQYGWAVSDSRGLQQRLSLRDINVAPNHREMAMRWAFSDNFYADSEVSAEAHRWLAGAYPNAWAESSLMAAAAGQKDFRLPTTAPGRMQFPMSDSSMLPEELPEAGALWHHLERHGVSFRNYGGGLELAGVVRSDGLEPTGGRYLTNAPMPDPLFRNTSRDYPQFNMNISDQFRAERFIAEIERKYAGGGEPFPRFLFIRLPNDHLAKPRPADGYPYEASFMADNDYALGRIVEYLTHSRWWREMAIFITEDSAFGGKDHIDSHRTLLLAVSPYARRNFVSHVNTSFPGLLKTIFRLLGLPPLHLFDAAASDLAHLFTSEPDFAPYVALPADWRLFDPRRARQAVNAAPSRPAADSRNDGGNTSGQQGRHVPGFNPSGAPGP